MHFVRLTVTAGLFLRSAVASFGYGGWGGDSHYSTPDNCDNKCSSDQTKGYDWSGLASGSFDSYGSNKFSNWSCTNSFGKRDLLTKRTFQSKCISSNLDDEPSIGCNGDDSMSIDKYEVSSSEDADIECHYEMPDKTVCKEYHSCKSGGTVIQNTQCGGARSVTFKPAKSFQGKGCNIGVHSIGFNCGSASSTVPAYSKTESIPAYASSSPPTYVTTSSESTTETVPTSSAVEITTDTTPYTSPTSTESVTSAVPTYGSDTGTAPSYETTTELSSSSSSPTQTAPIYVNTSSSTAPVYVSSSSSTASETAPVGTTQSAPSYETSTCLGQYGSSCSNTPVSSSGSSLSSATSRETSPIETSASSSSTTSASSTTSSVLSVVSIPAYPHSTKTGAVIPSYNTSLTYSIPAYTQSSSTVVEATSIGSYSSYTTSTLYSSTCETVTTSGTTATLTKTYAVSTTVAPVTSPAKESSPVDTTASSPTSYSGPAPSSPALLPRCLNTWLYVSGCSSSSDSSCYCKHEDFINKVYGCLSAWSQSADNATNGVSYLMGLCAPHIPQNPAIITGCPSTITPAAYTPPATTADVSSTSNLSQTSTITLQSTITVPMGSSSTEVSPDNTSSPPPTAPASVPCTTITYSSQITIPATYPSGSSQGSVIPSSSMTSAIVTTITVPQVILTTSTITESGSTITAPGLDYGTPTAPAVTTSSTAVSPATTSAVPVYGSGGFTKSTSASSVPSGIVPYEGAGNRLSTLNIMALCSCVLGALAIL